MTAPPTPGEPTLAECCEMLARPRAFCARIARYECLCSQFPETCDRCLAKLQRDDIDAALPALRSAAEREKALVESLDKVVDWGPSNAGSIVFKELRESEGRNASLRSDLERVRGEAAALTVEWRVVNERDDGDRRLSPWVARDEGQAKEIAEDITTVGDGWHAVIETRRVSQWGPAPAVQQEEQSDEH